MTTWTDAADKSTSYEFPADTGNGYVYVGYVQDGYILPEQIWTDASDASTVWA